MKEKYCVVIWEQDKGYRRSVPMSRNAAWKRVIAYNQRNNYIKRADIKKYEEVLHLLPEEI